MLMFLHHLMRIEPDDFDVSSLVPPLTLKRTNEEDENQESLESTEQDSSHTNKRNRKQKTLLFPQWNDDHEAVMKSKIERQKERNRWMLQDSDDKQWLASKEEKREGGSNHCIFAFNVSCKSVRGTIKFIR